MSGIDLNDIKRRMDGAINAFKSDIASLRTGRASANILDPVTIEAYGSRVPLNQVANITVPEPRMLGVNIWDKSMVNAVDRAIRRSISASTRSLMVRTCVSRCQNSTRSAANRSSR